MIRKAIVFFTFLVLSIPLFSQTDSTYTAITDTLKSSFDDPFNLEQVVVTATRSQKKLKSIPVITQVVTSRQIEERSISSIQELLQQEVPGLNFQEVGFGTDISLQGLGSKHILFLIDGERIAGENGGNIDYSRINLTNVERVEIVKGASSALYGSQAMGGVINIITRNAQKPVEVSAGIKYTNPNQVNFKDTPKDHSQYVFRRSVDRQNLNANVSLGLNLGNFTMNTDVAYKSFDGYQLYDRAPVTKYYPEFDSTYVGEINPNPTSISGFEDLNVSQKMAYRFNNMFKLQLRGTYYLMNKYDFVADNVYDNTEDFTYGGTFECKITPEHVINVIYHGDNYRRYDKFEKKEGRRLEYKNDIMQPRILYHTTALKNQELAAGIEFFREALYGDKFENDAYETKSQWYTTLFIQDDWNINKYLSLVVGLRGDYHKEYGANVTPKVSFMFKSPVTLRFNYARGYRSPSIKELYMDWDHLGMFWIYGNPDLKPESNNYISLSAEYSNKWINVSVNGYANWFKNKIEGMWTENQTELHYTNVGKSMLAGAEVLCKVKVCRYVFLHGNYNYLYTSTDENGVRLSSASPHSGTVRAEFKTLVPKYATVINFTGTIMGEKNFDVMDQLQINGQTIDTYYKAHVDTYSLWDFTVTQYLTDYVRLTLGIQNIFDFTADRVTFNSSTSPGRKFFVSCNFTF